MTLYIKFEDSTIGVIQPKDILKMSFICSIFKTFSMSKLIIRDFSKGSFNKIKNGSSVDVVFKDKDKQEYVNKMKVLSFVKAPGVRLNDVIELTLISSIYFDNAFGTNVYDGSVGTIIENIMSKFFKTSINSYKGTITDDLPRRRYQLSEKTLDFMKRILKYGVKESLPVYLFHDMYGNFNLKGLSEMMNDTPKFIAIPKAVYNDPSLYTKDESEQLVVMSDFITAFDGRNACSQISNKFVTSNFKFQDTVQTSYTYISVEDLTNQVETKTPKKVKFFGWNLAPSDAATIAIKEAFEDTYTTCAFKGVFQITDIDELDLGSVITIKLPYDKSEKNSKGQDSNLSEGKYLITDLEFSMDSEAVKIIASMIQIKS